jgi:hypothetical protein
VVAWSPPAMKTTGTTGKHVALGAGLLGLATVAGTLVVMKDRIREEWHLHVLETGGPEARARSVTALCELGSVRAIRPILDRLNRTGQPGSGDPSPDDEGDEEYQDTIERIVLASPAKAAVILAREYLRNRNEVNHDCVEMLADAVDLEPERFDPVIEVLLREKGANPVAVDHYLCSVIVRSRGDPVKAPGLVRLLEDADFHAEARSALIDLKAGAVPALVGALSHGDATVRILALSVLRAIGPDAAAAGPELRRALEDPDDQVRAAAAQALAAIGKEAR